MATFDLWLTLSVMVLAFVSMAREWLSPDATLMAALGTLVAGRVLELEVALQGFANSTILALGALYIIAAALRETGALAEAGQLLLGGARNVRRAVARQSVSVSFGSAFLNNTPIVAMGIPAVQSWARRHEVSASKLLIPLSYASILGGTCTLIGTSTNLVSDGLLRSHGLEGFGFFELAAVGVPCALVGWMYLIFVAPRLLASVDAGMGRPGECEEADGAAPGFVEEPVTARESHTAVVREGSRLVGMVVGEADFQEHFNARVTEVRREGRRVDRPVGDVVLQPGDTLVLDTGQGFKTAFEDAADFYITSGVGGVDDGEEHEERAEGSPRWQKWLSIGVLGSVIFVAAVGWLHIAVAALLGATTLMVAGVMNPGEAREAVDWEVVIVIGAALGLGKAMEASGAAELIGHGMVGVGESFGAVGLLAALVVGTAILTELITNNGAVALVFPIAASVAAAEGVAMRPMIVGVTIAASLSMSTPLGYQTNLMVYSAGDYRFSDFARVGLPCQVMLLAVAITVIPFVWTL